MAVIDQKENDENLDERLRNWAECLNALPPVRIEVFRVSPATWEGRKVDGKLGVFDELPDFEDIRSEYGGGKFRLVIKRPDSRGRMVYAGSRTVTIAGTPFIPPEAPLVFGAGERDRAVRKIATDTASELFSDRIQELEQTVRLLSRAR